MSQHSVQLGVIGGSGVYQIDGVEITKEHSIETPFGRPSDVIIEAKIAERPVLFLPRHGIGHRFTPSEVPYCANIHALKQLGVTHIMAISAVGIMRENIKPGDLVIPDQIFDRTKGTRRSTFFGDGVVGHVTFADPYCRQMRKIVADAARKRGATVHEGGALLCMEGPQFSTRSESHFYRKTLDPSVIGMTGLPEAKLAREAEMCFSLLALATDYDCWHDGHDDVTVDAVLAVLKANAELANAVTVEVATSMPQATDCDCQSAASSAIMTAPDKIPAATREKLQTLYGRYFSPS